jgi:hypothetical protein
MRQKNRQKPISVASQEKKSQIATLAIVSAVPGGIHVGGKGVLSWEGLKRGSGKTRK